MDVLTLRTEIETTLVDDLGVYTLANGVVTPAICVRSAGETLSTGQRVSGLECVIQRDPELTPVRQYRQQQAFARWNVFLVDWSGEVPLQDVASKLIWDYPGSETFPVRVPKGMGPRNQMRVVIQTNPDGSLLC